MSTSVYAIATMDTKGEELDYVRSCLASAGAHVTTVDVGTAAPPTHKPDIDRDTVFGAPWEKSAISDRGAAVTAMSLALTKFLVREQELGKVAGVIGIGGSGGTSLISAALRALPIGLPKLIVSTVASGNTAAYVSCSDITLMYSVVDVAGLNVVSRRVLCQGGRHCLVPRRTDCHARRRGVHFEKTPLGGWLLRSQLDGTIADRTRLDRTSSSVHTDCETRSLTILTAMKGILWSAAPPSACISWLLPNPLGWFPTATFSMPAIYPCWSPRVTFARATVAELNICNASAAII